MLTLIGKKEKQSFKDLQARLDELSLSYRMKYTSETPYLQDGETTVKGNSDIDAYLKDLDDELRRWYYCSV